MKKKLVILILIILVVSGVIYLNINRTYGPKQPDLDPKPDNPPVQDPITPEEELNKRIEEVMSNMTIEEKIAQMLVLYYVSDEVDSNLENILKTYNPGGFILMGYNMSTYEKTKKFVEDLQKNSKIPMIIATDQEGGGVQRLQSMENPTPLYIPYMYDLGKTNDKVLAYNTGKVMAEQLRTIGVNVTFAPVLDIYSNIDNRVIGKRSFGNDYKTVSDMALSLAKGLEDNGIIATYKHFPGHGDTATDSHYDLPLIDKTYEELKKEELIPFVNAIENGAKIIMIGHLAIPNVTGDNVPSSLSKKLITDILINDLKYDGLVITDAVNMGALTKNYSYEEIYTMAIEAGVDLLLMPNGSKTAIRYIKQNISEERIDVSVRKILKFKFTYLEDYEWLGKEYLNSQEQKDIIDKIVR